LSPVFSTGSDDKTILSKRNISPGKDMSPNNQQLSLHINQMHFELNKQSLQNEPQRTEKRTTVVSFD
jgi:hypothetical protein